MPREHDPTFTLENFGPIRAGSFTLRPLTVFIGPNNTGKSYTSTLVYALARELRHRFDSRDGTLLDLFPDVSEPAPASTLSLLTEIRNLVERREATFRQDVTHRVQMALWSYFGPQSIASFGGSASGSIQVSTDNKVLLSISVNNEVSVVFSEEIRPRVQRLALPDALARTLAGSEEVVAYLLVEEAWRRILQDFGLDFRQTWYLPPARSGFLTAWPMLTALTVDFVRRQMGATPIAIPPLSGTAADFVQILLGLISTAGENTSPEDNGLSGAVEALEQHVLRGTIGTSRSPRDIGDLQYVTGGLRLPVQRSSSMVGELAPLDLIMRRLLRPGDLLVMDEPEAHLHPENQRRIARVLARLAVAGVTVIAPTHSPTIIHQLSNLVRASQLDDATFRELGFDESDRIGPEMVGVYVFQSGENGSVIREVEFDPEFGYPEDEFLDVAESLSRQSYQIDEKHPVTA